MSPVVSCLTGGRRCVPSHMCICDRGLGFGNFVFPLRLYRVKAGNLDVHVVRDAQQGPRNEAPPEGVATRYIVTPYKRDIPMLLETPLKHASLIVATCHIKGLAIATRELEGLPSIDLCFRRFFMERWSTKLVN